MQRRPQNPRQTQARSTSGEHDGVSMPRPRSRVLLSRLAPWCDFTFSEIPIACLLAENAKTIAAHESLRTTKLYDRTRDEITLDDRADSDLTDEDDDEDDDASFYDDIKKEDEEDEDEEEDRGSDDPPLLPTSSPLTRLITGRLWW